MQVNLTGRRAIVTGGGRGIGRAISLALARNGADVAIVYHRGADAANQTADEARAAGGGRVMTVQADTADPAAVQAMVDRVVGKWGGIDILVNNAGILSRVPFLELPFDEWRSVLATNLDGCFLVGQAVAREMARPARAARS